VRRRRPAAEGTYYYYGRMFDDAVGHCSATAPGTFYEYSSLSRRIFFSRNSTVDLLIVVHRYKRAKRMYVHTSERLSPSKPAPPHIRSSRNVLSACVCARVCVCVCIILRYYLMSSAVYKRSSLRQPSFLSDEGV
jgi:hypothetical protein